MKNKLLPIGSVITYKKVDMMITGYFPIAESTGQKKKYKDYLCCLYPIGIKDNKFYMIDQEEIERVKFIGFQTPLEKKFIEKMTEARELYKKGMTDEEIIDYFKNKKEVA